MNKEIEAALREFAGNWIAGDIDLIGSPMYFEDKEDRVNAFIVDLTALISQHFVPKEDHDLILAENRLLRKELKLTRKNVR